MSTIMETYKKEKLESEKSLKESVTKLIDLESQITTYQIEERELKGKLEECFS